MKLGALREDSGFLSIQAEHNPDTENIQVVEGLRVSGVRILFLKSIVQFTNQLPRRNGDIQFLLDAVMFWIDQKIQSAVLPREIAQFQDFRRFLGLIHIVNLELLKIAGHDPTRVHVHGQFYGLLKERQKRTIGLLDRLIQVAPFAHLHDDNPGFRNISVKKQGSCVNL